MWQLITVCVDYLERLAAEYWERPRFWVCFKGIFLTEDMYISFSIHWKEERNLDRQNTHSSVSLTCRSFLFLSQVSPDSSSHLFLLKIMSIGPVVLRPSANDSDWSEISGEMSVIRLLCKDRANHLCSQRLQHPLIALVIQDVMVLSILWYRCRCGYTTLWHDRSVRVSTV